MRIISGIYKGRQLQGFNIEGTRPTMARIKESFIASIQNRIKNSICLDLFAGSGSIGLELISNGCNKCYFVDNNQIAINTLIKNIQNLKIEKAEIINQDYLVALKYFQEKQIKFDIIFLDPPYKNNYINKALKVIYEYQLLNNQGIIILEYESEEINTDQFKILKEKKYGDKYVKIIQNKI